MEFSTPYGLYPTVISISEDGSAFVLAHPVGDGPVDMDTSIIFKICDGVAQSLRVFPFELTGLIARGDQCLAVDLECNAYLYSDDSWTDYSGIGADIERINALRLVNETIFGVAGEGLIYKWSGEAWTDIVEPTEDLYLYDICSALEGKLYVCGEDGFFGKIEGRILEPFPLPTNVDITSILSLENQKIVLTGWGATVLQGDIDELQIVDSEGRETAFANSVNWQGHILVAATDEILELSDAQLSNFDDVPAQRLVSKDVALWRQWDNGVADYFDGNWRIIRLSVEI